SPGRKLPLLFCGLREYQSSRMILSQIYPLFRLICGHKVAGLPGIQVSPNNHMRRRQTMHEKLSHPLHNPSYADIIIVGGGLSGLAAATYAAKSGRTVTLFEKASEPGGRAITKQRNGFSLNLGAHALYYQTEAGEVLR